MIANNLSRLEAEDKSYLDDPAWDFIDEVAALAAVQANLIRYCAERGDKAGAAFGARRLRACVRAIGETIKEEIQ